MKLFGRRHCSKRRLEGGATAGSTTPGLGQIDHVSPLVAAGTEAGEELIDPDGGTVASLRHWFFPSARNRFCALLPCYFRYYRSRRAPPLLPSISARGPLFLATVCKKHRFTDAPPPTSWRPPKIDWGESAGVTDALRLQQAPRQKPFRFISVRRANSLMMTLH